MQTPLQQQFTVQKTDGEDVIVDVESVYPTLRGTGGRFSDFLVKKGALIPCGNNLYARTFLKELCCFVPNIDTVHPSDEHCLLSTRNGDGDLLYGPFRDMLKFTGREPGDGEVELRIALGMCKHFHTFHNVGSAKKTFKMAWCPDCHPKVYPLYASQGQLPYLAKFLQQFREGNVTYYNCLEFGMYLPLDFTT